MVKFLARAMKKVLTMRAFRITFAHALSRFSKSRDIDSQESQEINRDMKVAPASSASSSTPPDAQICPHCASANFVKRGRRQKKFETVQLYRCNDCRRTFTAQAVRGRRFPLTVILEAMTLYNLGYTLEETSQLLQQRFGFRPQPATISAWLAQYEPLCRYSRLRSYSLSRCPRRHQVEVTTMSHRQVFRFRYHRGKLGVLLEEFKHAKLQPLRDYLEAVPADTPHQYFQSGLRISDVRSRFDKAQMVVRGKYNYANRLAALVLPTVRNNKNRHEAVQRFMLANDSVTVAAEVPVYIRQEDIEHLQNALRFNVLSDKEMKMKGSDRAVKATNLLLTGHIDLLQVRNGLIHLLDYKPRAASMRPIEQLTWYALALSRLTGLRLFEFKCAWFDEKEYFEFYPLHVVHKLKAKSRRKTIRYQSGDRVVIPQEDKLVVASQSHE